MATGGAGAASAGAKLEAELFEVALHQDVAALEALRADWDDLLRRAPKTSVALGCDYVLQGWSALPKSGGARLAVVTVRRGGRLVCVWPLYVRREGLTTAACHLGSGAREEYAGPLTADGEDSAVVRAALGAVRRLADRATVYSLRADSPAVEVLASAPGFKHRWSVQSPVTSLIGVADWESWARTASKKLRSNLRYDRKRLEALGVLAFRRMAGPEDGPRCVDWIFASKRAWLRTRKMGHSWMDDAQGRDFFAALAARPPAAAGEFDVAQAFALTLDDKIIAACICLGSGDRMEYFTTAFDPEFGLYSPGNLLIEDCVRLAIQQGVDFDMRITQQAYKKRWMDRADRYDSFALGFTPAGTLAVAVSKMQADLHALRVRLAPRIKALLGRGSNPERHGT